MNAAAREKPDPPEMKKTSAKDALVQEIEALQKQHEAIARELQQKMRALSALESAEIVQRSNAERALPFAGMRTWKAIRIYLEREGEPRTVGQITKAMITGGAMYGKRTWRAERNVNTAIKMAKDLEVISGKIYLSEWLEKGGKFAHLKK